MGCSSKKSFLVLCNKYNLLIGFTLLIIFSSCSIQNKQVSLDTNDTLVYDILDISKGIFLNQSVSSFEAESELYIRKDSCGSEPIYPNQGRVYYNCLKPNDGSSYTLFELNNKVFLGYLKFDTSNLKIIFPDFELSENTRIQELKNKYELSTTMLGSEKDLRYPNCDIFVLYDDLNFEMKPFPNKVKLIFKNDSLRYFEYLIRPDYTSTQLSKFKEYTKKNR